LSIRSNTGFAIALCLALVTFTPSAGSFPGKRGKSKPPPIEAQQEQFLPGDGVDRSGSYGSFMLALLAERKGDYQSAIKQFEKAASQDDKAGQPLRHAADLYLRLGNIKSAEKMAVKCVAILPDSPDCLQILAGINASQGNYPKATEYLGKLLKVNPEDTGSLVALAVNHLKSGDPDKAITILEGAQPSSPHEFIFDKYFLGRAHIAKNDYPKAISTMEELFSRRPDFSVTLENLAWLYRMTGQWDKAIDLYNKYLSINSSDLKMQQALEKVLDEKESGRSAQSMLAEISKDMPQEIDYRFFLGMTKWQQAEVLRDTRYYHEALAEFQLVRAASPSNQNVLSYIAAVFESLNLLNEAVNAWKLIDSPGEFEKKSVMLKIADLYDRLGAQDKSLEHTLQAIKLDPDDPELRFLEGFLHGKLKKNDKAIEALNEALERNPNNPKYYFHQGVIYERMGKFDKCIEVMKKAVALQPDHSNALNYLGYIYAEQNQNLDEAEKYLLQALELEPNNGYFIDSLGWLYYKQKKYDEALGQILTAVRNITPDPTVLEHLGDIYAAMSRPEDAAESYQRSLDAKVYDDRVIDRQSAQRKLDEIKKAMKEKASR